MSKDREITIAGEIDVDYPGGGFFVVEISREQHGSNRAPVFAIGVSEYPSRQSWEMRNDNAMIGWSHDEDIITKIAPEAARVMLPVDGCWTDNGEPTQGVANGWYWLSGDAAQYEADYRLQHGHKNMPESPDELWGADWCLYWLGVTARALRCEVHELAAINFDLPLPHGQYLRFIDDVLRPRWQQRADEANAWMDAYEGDHRPAEDRDEPLFEFEFENGLKLRATLDEHNEGPIDDRRYWYYVTISAPGVKPYKAKWGGSQADHQEGRVSAREAAFGTAKGLFDYQYEDARGYVENSLGESWEDLPRATRTAMERASEAFDRLETFLTPNEGVIGR